jgi:hypothetical protein
MADDTDYHHHHCHDRHDELRTDADYRSLISQGSVNGDRINTGVMVTGDRINAVGAAAAAAACRTNELVQGTACKTDQLVLEGDGRTREVTQAGFGDVHDRLCDATGKLMQEIDRHGDAAALAACKIGDEIADAKLQTAVGFKDQIIAQNVGFSAQSVLSTTIGNAASVLANSIGNAASVQATANYNGLTVQATNNFNQTTVQIERVRAELEAKTAAGFAAATLLAFQNKADSDAKAAKCCCDAEMTAARNFAALQALITAEGVAGRALANEIEARRVQNELQRLQTQVIVLTGGAVGGAARAG